MATNGQPSREPSPPRGAAGPDHIENPSSSGCPSLSEWRKSRGIDAASQIKLVKLAHMRYQHPDLKQITTFLRDFGMHVAKKSADGERIWYRGYGSDQYVYYAQKGAERKFLGGTFEVESMAELEKASKLPTAGSITELTDAPGGGHLLTLHDPEGFPVNLMYGQTPLEPGKLPQTLAHNYESSKPREKAFLRYQPGPAAVHKLGHFGLCVTDFPAQVEWYTKNFNFAPTDFLHVDLPEGAGKKDVALFAHIDRGDDLVDHHTFFMSTNKTSHVHHCSFEVHDIDTQHLGHKWLEGKGYTSVWGVGRHILGSQIFDYWWDTTGNMIEHYADGDLVNQGTPIGYRLASDEALAVWGPDVPGDFLE